MSDLVVKITGDSSGAVQAIADVSNITRDFADQFLMKIAELSGGLLTFQKGIEAIKDGINFADTIRDLGYSLTAFTGSVEAGRQALEYFEQQASKTRATAEEMAGVFRDILPLSNSRGLSQDVTEQFTVMLAQLSTVAGTSLDSMESGFQRLLAGSGSGGGAARNPLARVLGLDAESLKTLDFGTLYDRMKEVAQHADEMGQSFQSAFGKGKEAWEEAFGSGFNAAMDNNRTVTEAFMDAFKDPEVLKSVQQIGDAFGHMAIFIADAAHAMPELQSQIRDFVSGNNGPLSLLDLLIPGLGTLASGAQAEHNMANAGDPNAGESAWQAAARQRNYANFHGGYRSQQAMLSAFQSGNDKMSQADEDWRQTLLSQAAIAEAAKKAAQEWDDYVTLVHGLNQFMGQMVGPEIQWGSGGFGLLTRTNAFGNANLAPLRPDNQWSVGPSPTISPTWQSWLGGMATLDPSVVENAKQIAASIADAVEKAMESQEFVSKISDAFASAALGGTKGLFQSLQGDFEQLVQTGSKSLMTDLFGSPVLDANGKPTGGWQGGVFGSHGQQVASGVNMGMAAAGDVLSAYQAGKTGSGSELQSVIAGASAGAAFGPYGAIIGGILGYIGYTFGADNNVRPDALVGVGANGVAFVGSNTPGSGNLLPSDMENIRQQAQQIFDQTHDALVKIIVGFPDVALPKPEAFGQLVDDKFHEFSQNLQNYLNQTLPKTIMGAFTDQLAQGFEQLGMSPDAFNKLWSGLQNIGPQQAIQAVQTLETALTNLNTRLPGNGESVWSFMQNQSPFGPGYGTIGAYQYGLMDIAQQRQLTPGQLIGQNAAFGNSADSQLMKDFTALQSGGLSPEDQIATINEIAQLTKQRYDAEKAAIQDIYNVAQAMKQQFQSAQDQLTLQGMVNPDGTPRYQDQANFYASKAQQDYQNMMNAKSAADVQTFSQTFIQDIMQAEQLGIQGGGDRNTWIQWAQGLLGQGQSGMTTTLDHLGQSITDANNDLTKLDPALQAFLQGLKDSTGPNSPIGTGPGGIGDPGGPVKQFPKYADAMNQAMDQSTTSINDSIAAIQSFTAAIVAATAALSTSNQSSSIVSRRRMTA